MNLLTVGDSFTYGQELLDLNNAWPHILGKQIGYTVQNLGLPGTGNTQMVRNVLTNYQSADLIIIAWSHYARMEFADHKGIFDLWPGYKHKWPDDLLFRTKLSEYITWYHNDIYMYNQYLNNVLLIQQFLKSKNKKFLMMEAFGNIDDRKLGNEGIHYQIDDQYFLGWPSESMVEWVYPCPNGPNGHFLDEGHNKVADKIYEHIKNLNWV